MLEQEELFQSSSEFKALEDISCPVCGSRFQSSSEFKRTVRVTEQYGNIPFNPLLSLRDGRKWKKIEIEFIFQSSSEFKWIKEKRN